MDNNEGNEEELQRHLDFDHKEEDWIDAGQRLLY